MDKLELKEIKGLYNLLQTAWKNYTGSDNLENVEIQNGQLTFNTIDLGVELEADDLCDPEYCDYDNIIYHDCMDTDTTFYECSECGNFFEYEESAAECCGHMGIYDLNTDFNNLKFDYKFKSDSSLNDGAELIIDGTAPLKYFNDIFNDMIYIMNNQKTSPYYSDNCGLHIHISDRHINLKTKLNKFLIDFIYKNCINKKIIDILHTRDDEYAQAGTNLYNDDDRYYEINFCRENTVEFRLFDARVVENDKKLQLVKKLLLCIIFNLNILREFLKQKQYNNTIKLYYLTEKEHSKPLTFKDKRGAFMDFLICNSNNHNSLYFLEKYGLTQVERLLSLQYEFKDYYYKFDKNDQIFKTYYYKLYNFFNYDYNKYKKINDILKNN